MASSINLSSSSSQINSTIVQTTNTARGTIEKTRSLSPATHETVRTVGLEDLDKASECLSQAFATDDVARYFVDTPDMEKYGEEVKYKLHCDIIQYITAAHCLSGLVTTIGPEFDAVALWLPPRTNIDSFYTIIRSGLWRLYYKLSAEGRHRYFTEFIPLLHDTKHDILKERDDDSWYLVYLGSKPSARGKGYARALIEHGLNLADAASQPTYLESSAFGNIAYYKKFGFEEKLNIVLTRGLKPVYLNIMVREPKAKKERIVKAGDGGEREKLTLGGSEGMRVGRIGG